MKAGLIWGRCRAACSRGIVPQRVHGRGDAQNTRPGGWRQSASFVASLGAQAPRTVIGTRSLGLGCRCDQPGPATNANNGPEGRSRRGGGVVATPASVPPTSRRDCSTSAASVAVANPTASRTTCGPGAPLASTRTIKPACGAAPTRTRTSRRCTRISWANRSARSPSSCSTRATTRGPLAGGSQGEAAGRKATGNRPQRGRRYADSSAPGAVTRRRAEMLAPALASATNAIAMRSAGART